MIRARPKITLHFKRRSILPDCVTKTYKYLDIPTFSRLVRQAPQHLKLPIYFWANPKGELEVREHYPKYGEGDDAEPLDSQDLVNHYIEKSAAARGSQANLSFFAFTATPKYKILAVFGYKDSNGKPQPFHLYSMRQAIEEGFILDYCYPNYQSVICRKV